MHDFVSHADAFRQLHKNQLVAALHLQIKKITNSSATEDKDLEHSIIRDKISDRLDSLGSGAIYRFVDERSADVMLPISNPESADELTAYLQRTFEKNDCLFAPKIDVGLCLWESNMAAFQVLNNARIACYHQTHATFPGINIFDIERNIIEDKKSLRQQEVIKAIRDRELVLFLQPKIDLKTAEIIGFEALSRWVREDNSIVMPNQFLPAIEGTEIEILMGYYVVDRAIELVHTMNQHSIYLPININISPKQISDINFAMHIANAVNINELERASIGIEILESNHFVHLEQAKRILKTYRQSAIDIALDDFGTGYASLSYLVELPINEVKIDRFFISRSTDSELYRSLIKGVVGLAKEIGLKVTAEGIETQAQDILLRELGVDYGQGYLYQRPMTIDAFLQKYVSAPNGNIKVDR